MLLSVGQQSQYTLYNGSVAPVERHDMAAPTNHSVFSQDVSSSKTSFRNYIQ